MDEVTQIGMPMPPEAAAVDAEDQRRRASLAGLSLNKGAQTMPVVVRAPTSSSKLPWVLLVLVLVGGGVYFAKVREPSAPRPPVAAATVSPTTPVRMGDLVASGYIAAKAPIVLAASSGGRLAELKVDNGDRVQKGQTVAVIADGPLRAELSLANARLRDAQRSLQRMRAAFNAQGATTSDVERAVGAVEIASAESHVITQKLEETKIRSPVNGTVLEVLARPGEALTAGPSGSAGVMRIADLSLLVAEADISEADLKGIAIDQSVEVTTDSQRDRSFKARVREISKQADRSRGTVLVRSYLDATADTVLKPGMAVQVRFLRDEPKPAAPDTALPTQGTPATATPATPASAPPAPATSSTAPVVTAPQPVTAVPDAEGKPSVKAKAKVRVRAPAKRPKSTKRPGALDI